MSECISGEQLEASSGGKTNTEVECCECGTMIDVEQDTYGQSIDGEKYACYDCMEDYALLQTIFHNHINRWGCTAKLHKNGCYRDCETVATLRPNEHEASKRTAEMAEIVWGVKSYIERN